MFLQGTTAGLERPKQGFCFYRRAALIDHALDDRALAGDALVDFGNLPIGLCARSLSSLSRSVFQSARLRIAFSCRDLRLLA